MTENDGNELQRFTAGVHRGRGTVRDQGKWSVEAVRDGGKQHAGF